MGRPGGVGMKRLKLGQKGRNHMKRDGDVNQSENVWIFRLNLHSWSLQDPMTCLLLS